MGLPSTLGQLALLVALLLPGLAFALHREWHRPRPKLSAFRESAVVVFAGVAIDLVVVAVAVAVVHFCPTLGVEWPPLSVPVDTLTGAQFVEVFWRAAVLLAVAISGGWFAGGRTAHRLASWMRLADRGRSEGSAWWILFDKDSVPKGTTPYAGIELEDGQWFEGYVATFSTVTDDSADRELILTGEVKYREAGQRSDPEPFDGADAVSLSARQMRFVRVTYIDSPEQDAQPPAQEDRASEAVTD